MLWLVSPSRVEVRVQEPSRKPRQLRLKLGLWPRHPGRTEGPGRQGSHTEAQRVSTELGSAPTAASEVRPREEGAGGLQIALGGSAAGGCRSPGAEGRGPRAAGSH